MTHIANMNGPHSVDLHQYIGDADRGICIQITALNHSGAVGIVGMTQAEAREVANTLTIWCNTRRRTKR